MQHPLTHTVKRALFALYAVVVLVGIGVVLVREPVVETPRRPEAKAAFEQAVPGATDLAHWERGAIVRASSYYTLRQHHPLFLIDGVAKDADPLQKWVSRTDDQDPWVEVELPGRIDLSGVVISHAGAVESPNLSVNQYDVACLRGGEEVARETYFEQVATTERHELVCADVDTLRVEFRAGPSGRSEDVARIYEIEMYGTPSDD